MNFNASKIAEFAHRGSGVGWGMFFAFLLCYRHHELAAVLISLALVIVCGTAEARFAATMHTKSSNQDASGKGGVS